MFLYEGSKVLFRFALAFLKMYEEELLALNDSVMINTLLRTLGEQTCDVRTLCKIAFSLLNPFPLSKVKSKRAFYTKQVQSELDSINEQRRQLPDRDGDRDSDNDGPSD